MFKIRKGLFETNSSSTHSLTMCPEEDYNKWRNDELFFNSWEEKFFTKKEMIDSIIKSGYYTEESISNFPEDKFNEVIKDYGFYTYDKYWEDDYLEWFLDTYTTKSGETIVAFGKYGYDG